MSTIKGISPIQTINNYKDSEQTAIRSILRRSWNQKYATGNVNGHARAIGEFKAVSNIGDYLSRKNYACGNIPNPTQPDNVKWRSRIGGIMKQCDQTGVPCSNSNTKFIPDSSDYTTYRKQRALNRNYNDWSNGGDQSHASYVSQMAIRRF
uniref:Uncharacterized protein n=1 Tax=viral metagenome TaxID=1070528 RepID=A0A6C0HU61_9ZZZZ